jgi:copper chaperone
VFPYTPLGYRNRRKGPPMGTTETKTTEYDVTGMSCGHCEVAVREEVSAVAGVETIEVSAQSGRLVVTGGSFDEAAVIAAVDEAGYAAERA